MGFAQSREARPKTVRQTTVESAEAVILRSLAVQLEKLACGRFSDIGFGPAAKGATFAACTRRICASPTGC
jgi:hypothetical protein